MWEQRQDLLEQNPYMLGTPYTDVDMDGAYGILKSTNSNIYYGQAAFGPTLVPETCKYPDCDSNSNSIVIGGVRHSANLPEELLSWEKSYMSSTLNQDRELGEPGLLVETQLYAMQPQRPCSNATGRVLVNVIPVCEDCNEENDVEDPCHSFRGSSYDWSRPLHFGQGSNYLVEDTTGGGFMPNNWDKFKTFCFDILSVSKIDFSGDLLGIK